MPITFEASKIGLIFPHRFTAKKHQIEKTRLETWWLRLLARLGFPKKRLISTDLLAITGPYGPLYLNGEMMVRHLFPGEVEITLHMATNIVDGENVLTCDYPSQEGFFLRLYSGVDTSAPIYFPPT